MKLHSYTDLITNSSQTMFIVRNADIKEVQRIVDGIDNIYQKSKSTFRQHDKDVWVLSPNFDISEYEVDIAYTLGYSGYLVEWEEYHGGV